MSSWTEAERSLYQLPFSCNSPKMAMCSSKELQAARAWVPRGSTAWNNDVTALLRDSLLLCRAAQVWGFAVHATERSLMANPTLSMSGLILALKVG